MSLESWKAEFYQLDADAEAVQVDDITRTRHSLQKWIGLRKGNLERHAVRKGVTALHDSKTEFFIDADTCALCVAHYDRECVRCPLYKQLGNNKCYAKMFTTRYPAEYNIWVNQGNPEPMIAALEATLQSLTNGNDNSPTHS